MSVGANAPETVIRECTQCRTKNRIPVVPPKTGTYTCGSCHAPLAAASNSGSSDQRRIDALRTRITTITMRRGVPLRLAAAYALWAILLLAITVSNAVGPDRWWLGSANLYIPQWIWALPAAAIVPWSLRVAPRLAFASIPLLLWVFGPLMGFVCHPGGNVTEGVAVRMMQCNVKWAQRDPQGLAAEVLRQKPDIIQLQDSGGDIKALGPISEALAGWNIDSSGQYITASRLPLSPVQNIDISYPGSDHHCTRILVTVAGVQVALYNVHLLSPRWGLISVRHHDAEGMTANADQRLVEAERLAGYLRREPGPVLLTGDLNAPMQSLVCRDVMGSQLKDAFQESGFGYGYSYGRYATQRVFSKLHLPDMGQPFTRIDHILYSGRWEAAQCWTGSDTLSDHVPVYADLYFDPDDDR